MADFLQSKSKQPGIVLSFDDGHRSILTNAMPIMQKYGYTPTCFITTDFMQGAAIPWWDAIYADQTENQQTVIDQVKTNPDVESAIRMKYADTHLNHDYLNQKEIRQLVEQGCEIGFHAKTHRRLSALSTLQLQEEFEGIHELEIALGRPITAMAYPFGRPQDINSRVFEWCEKFNIAQGFTTVAGELRDMAIKASENANPMNTWLAGLESINIWRKFQIERPEYFTRDQKMIRGIETK